MSKKILVDMMKCRECKDCSTDCVYIHHPGNNGMKAIREMAAFAYTCRHCEDAPCISACPARALEKDSDGIVHRFTLLCVACRSCVSICPFGTLMNDFFAFRNSVCNYCNLDDSTKSLACIDSCCEKAISLTDMGESRKENIYALNDKVMVRELTWDKLKHE